MVFPCAIGGRRPPLRVMDTPVASSSDLGPRLRRLIFFRVVMVTTLLLIAAYVEAISESLAPVNPLYFLVAATYVLTVGHAVALRYLRALVPQVYAQVLGDLVVITGLVYISGGIRTGFMLLYPLSVLSGSVLLRRRGGIVVAGLATLLYGGALWAVRSGPGATGGSRGSPLPSPAHRRLLRVRDRRDLRQRGPDRGLLLREPAPRGGDGSSWSRARSRTFRGSTTSSSTASRAVCSPRMREGRILWVNPVGEGILGVTTASARGQSTSQVFDSSFLELSAVRARAGSRSLARLEVPYRRPDGTVTRSRSLGGPPDRGKADGGWPPPGLPGPDGRQAPRGGGADQGEAGGGRGDGGPARARDPQPARLHQRLRPGAPAENRASPRSRSTSWPSSSRESKRLSDTSNRFLFQARTPGRSRGPVDLVPLISEALTLLRNGPEVGRQHQVEFDVDPGPLVCMADPDQIVQVFWNLARNGLEAMPERRPSPRAVAPRRRRDRAFRSGPGARDGPGRAAEDVRALPFRRAAMGTGLGLAIVYRIVREHRGDITVRTAPSRGTQVDVRLPVVPVPIPVEA